MVVATQPRMNASHHARLATAHAASAARESLRPLRIRYAVLRERLAKRMLAQSTATLRILR